MGQDKNKSAQASTAAAAPRRSFFSRVIDTVLFLIVVPFIHISAFIIANFLAFHSTTQPILQRTLTKTIQLLQISGPGAQKKFSFLAVGLQVVITFTSYWLVVFAQSLFGDENYNNVSPRSQLDHSKGLVRRLYSAHKNHLETTPILVAAVVTAFSLKVPAALTAKFCLLFLLARIAFTLFYILNIDLLRSQFFGISIMCCLSIILYGVYPELATSVREYVSALAFGGKDEL